ncbi:hypothetical protein FACS1894204_12020 [Synergistales bacterium]|nr:hypothetical protein FACS1894204_12020 [Synergistales bacterium]
MVSWDSHTTAWGGKQIAYKGEVAAWSGVLSYQAGMKAEAGDIDGTGKDTVKKLSGNVWSAAAILCFTVRVRQRRLKAPL